MTPKKETIYEITVGDVELHLYPPTDTAIRWAKLGSVCLHYLDTEESQLKNVWFTDEVLPYLKQMGIRVYEAEEDDMYESEYEQYLDTQAHFLDKWEDL
jgi:hypothetical protein